MQDNVKYILFCGNDEDLNYCYPQSLPLLKFFPVSFHVYMCPNREVLGNNLFLYRLSTCVSDMSCRVSVMHAVRQHENLADTRSPLCYITVLCHMAKVNITQGIGAIQFSSNQQVISVFAPWVTNIYYFPQF